MDPGPTADRNLPVPVRNGRLAPLNRSMDESVVHDNAGAATDGQYSRQVHDHLRMTVGGLHRCPAAAHAEGHGDVSILAGPRVWNRVLQQAEARVRGRAWGERARTNIHSARSSMGLIGLSKSLARNCPLQLEQTCRTRFYRAAAKQRKRHNRE